MGLFNDFPYSNFHELNNDWIVKTVKELGEKINNLPFSDEYKNVIYSAVAEYGKFSKIYTSASDMTADTIPLDDAVLCYNNGIPGLWRVVTAQDVNTVQRSDGTILQFVYLATVHLGAFPAGDDLSPIFNHAYNSGARNFALPAGTYTLNIDQPLSRVKIMGEGSENTTILCAPTADVYISARDFSGSEITGITFRLSQNLFGTTDFLRNEQPNAGSINNCRFYDVIIENFLHAINVTSGFIWNEFYNCRFFGCSGNAVVFKSDSLSRACNNNTFYSCRISDNCGAAIEFLGPTGSIMANSFISCNIENNNNTLGGIQGTSAYIVQTAGGAAFLSCYFENNTPYNSSTVIFNVTNQTINIIGCSFSLERCVFANGGINVIINAFGNFGYDSAMPYTLADTTQTFALNVAFNQNIFEGTKARYTSQYLEFTASNEVWTSGSKDALYGREEIYVKIFATDTVTLAANIMASGQAETIEAGHYGEYYISQGKLW